MADREPSPVVYVEWIDSAIIGSGWEDRGALVIRALSQADALMQSTGFLVHFGSDTIVLALSLNPFLDDVAQTMTIPRTAIRKMVLWDPRMEDVTDPAVIARLERMFGG